VERLGVFKENIHFAKMFLFLFMEREFFNRGAVFPFLKVQLSGIFLCFDWVQLP